MFNLYKSTVKADKADIITYVFVNHEDTNYRTPSAGSITNLDTALNPADFFYDPEYFNTARRELELIGGPYKLVIDQLIDEFPELYI